MKVTTVIGRVIKPLVNFPRWMGARQLKTNADAIIKMVKDLQLRRPPLRQETFEEAIVRLHLSEEDIRQRMRVCLTLSIIYSCLMILFLAYTIFLILHFSLGMILAALVTMLMASFVYREHFWYFQMKTRKLGNTFQDWVSFLVRGKLK